MTVSSPPNRLTTNQRFVLWHFFDRERAFFLTGGGALAGFYLGHRTTDHLDLFTTDDAAFERGRFVLADVAAVMGATVGIREAAPRFVRIVVSRGDDAVVVDLVRDAAQHHAAKPERDGIRLDSMEEILINKLGTLVRRAEERDLVDLLCLERAGLRVEDALAGAVAKDGGCTPATLAWLLSEVVIADSVVLPAGVVPADLRAFVADLIVRFRRAALPD